MLISHTISLNMKKNYLYLLICFFSMCSCSDEKEEMVTPYLTTDIENNLLNVPIEGKTINVKVHTNLSDWELSPNIPNGYDWCHTSVGLSHSDTHLLTFTITPHNGAGKREAKFTLQGKGTEDIIMRIVQMGSEPAILVDIESKTLSKDAQTFTVKVTANVEYLLRNEKEWLTQEQPRTKGMVESDYQYSVTANTGLSARQDIIYVESTGQMEEPIIVKIPVKQNSADIDDVIPDDIKVGIKSVKMIQGNHFGDQKPENTIDGDLSTTYSSAKQTTPEPVILEYTLDEGVEKVDYVVLRQFEKATIRNQLTKGSIAYRSASSPDWQECGTFDEQDIVSSIRVNTNMQAPTSVRLILQRTEQSPPNVALAEFECYQKAIEFDLEADRTYFEDHVFSQLKPTTTQADIEKITHPMIRAVAQELLENMYSTEFRVRTYQSCKNPEIVGKELTIGKRSICDNPTGLFFEKGKKYIVFVGDEIGENVINLYICDWRKNNRDKQTIKLKRGLNTLETPIDGLGYIQYWTETETANPPVKVHVCQGNEIGFWDIRAGHQNDDWKRILRLANQCAQRLHITNAMIDVLGEHIQLVNTVQAFNTYCPDDIEGIISKHDELLRIEYSMMGLVKNNVVPRNRMLGVRSWGDSPNWNGTCANFPNNEQPMLDKGAFLQNIWVFGHEFGHGNQVEQMKSGGWGEVTNNLYTQQAMYLMNNGYCRLEHETFKREGYDKGVIGDRFNDYLFAAVIDKKTYLTKDGLFDDPDKGEYYKSSPFVSLAPLWQLSLFFMLATDAPWHTPDFWPDIHWAAINDNRPEYTYGERYVKFMKRSMDISGYDLTDFFEHFGLLREMNIKVAAYGPASQVTITKAMVDEVKAHAQGKLQPPTPVIHYISGNSLNAYNKQLPVQGIFDQGISSGVLSKTISHTIWKNVVAFETYADNKLVEISIAGTGSANNASTLVRYPQGATRIEAVAWDGTRTLVCGTRQISVYKKI